MISKVLEDKPLEGQYEGAVKGDSQGRAVRGGMQCSIIRLWQSQPNRLMFQFSFANQKKTSLNFRLILSANPHILETSASHVLLEEESISRMQKTATQYLVWFACNRSLKF